MRVNSDNNLDEKNKLQHINTLANETRKNVYYIWNPKKLDKPISENDKTTLAEDYSKKLQLFYQKLGFKNDEIPDKILTPEGKLNPIIGEKLRLLLVNK